LGLWLLIWWEAILQAYYIVVFEKQRGSAGGYGAGIREKGYTRHIQTPLSNGIVCGPRNWWDRDEKSI